MKTLLAEGADVNLASDRGQTPLMLAAVFGHEEIARLLVGAGANLSLKDSLGLTARDWAERRGFQNIRILIEQAKSSANGEATLPTRPSSPSTNGGNRFEARDDLAQDVPQSAPRPSGLISVLRARAAEASREADLATEVPAKSLSSPKAIAPQVKAQPVRPPIAVEPVKPAPTAAPTPAPAAATRSSIPPRPTGPLNIGAAQADLLTPSASHSSAKMILWGLVIATFVGASFLTYRLMNRPSTPAPAAAPAVVKTEPLKIAPVKPTPVVAGDVAGAELTVPAPQVPAVSVARITRDNSIVTVRVQVNRKGKVTSARVTSGEAFLRSAATTAAKQATFAADKLPAKPKVLTGTITYTLPVAEATATSSVTSKPVSADHPIVSQELAGAELSIPKADYPGSAKSKRIEGTITVTVRVGRTGKVVSWRTSNGDYQLRMAALKAAKKATFSPEKLAGKGDVVGTITYTFKD